MILNLCLKYPTRAPASAPTTKPITTTRGFAAAAGRDADQNRGRESRRQHLPRHADIEESCFQGYDHGKRRKQHRGQRIEKAGKIRDDSLVPGIGGLGRKPGALEQIVVGQERIFSKEGNHHGPHDQADQDGKDRNHVGLSLLMTYGGQYYLLHQAVFLFHLCPTPIINSPTWPGVKVFASAIFWISPL